MKKSKDYYYLHTNGSLIHKNALVVDSVGAKDYFDSNFVVKYWIVRNGEDLRKTREEATQLIKSHNLLVKP